jgi:hypothetical protein
MSWLYCPACETCWPPNEGSYCNICGRKGDPDFQPGDNDE